MLWNSKRDYSFGIITWKAYWLYKKKQSHRSWGLTSHFLVFGERSRLNGRQVPNTQQALLGQAAGERAHCSHFLVCLQQRPAGNKPKERSITNKQTNNSLAQQVPLSETRTVITRFNTRGSSRWHPVAKYQHLCHPGLREISGACSNANHSGDAWSPLSWVKHSKQSASGEGTHQLFPQPFVPLPAWWKRRGARLHLNSITHGWIVSSTRGKKV